MDIVIDTNVLVHAENKDVPYNQDSIELANTMKIVDTLLCVDEGFHLDKAQNKSFIGYEYLKHLKPGTLGYGLIVYLAINERLRFLPKNPNNETSRWINRKISNYRDRIFCKVAYNSTEKVLSSHDFHDFTTQRRAEFKQVKRIQILTASEALLLL